MGRPRYTPGRMLRLGSLGKTSIDLDLSFIILIVFFVAMNYNAELGVQYALIWIPVIFLSVLIHELAHAGAIAALGFGSSQIILGGMGGATFNQRRARPWQELVISVAGPASSFALAFVVSLMMNNFAVMQQDPMLRVLLPLLVLANIFWGMFNLIPVAPLDGGHAVRSFLRMFLDERQAFVGAIWVAFIGGGAIAVYAAMRGQFFIALFIAWFLYQNFQAWQYFREHGVPGD